jgi:hypothetical protein
MVIDLALAQTRQSLAALLLLISGHRAAGVAQDQLLCAILRHLYRHLALNLAWYLGWRRRALLAGSL